MWRFGMLLLALSAVSPLLAQADLSGNWSALQHQDWMERGPGPDPADFLGTPLNEQALAKALAYSISQLSMPEHQCELYPPTYMLIGPMSLKIRAIVDPTTDKVVDWRMSGAADMAVTNVWMDGRPAPSENAPHAFEGFTTGVWEGNTLTTRTIDIKAGNLRRNGVPISDRAVITRHFTRHGNLLTVEMFVEDPVYLTEPYVMSRTFELNTAAPGADEPYHCSPEPEVARLGETGVVPHILPGENTFPEEFSKMYHLPVDVVLGGAAEMYPEFRKQLKDKYVPPDKCVRYCCGWGGGSASDEIKCIGVGFADAEHPFGRRR